LLQQPTMEQKRTRGVKYALCVEINQWLHTTIDVYSEDNGFDLESFKSNPELREAVEALLKKWQGKAALNNTKKRYDSFNAKVLHVAVTGTWLDETREALDGFSWLTPCRVDNASKGHYYPHITYKQSMPAKDVYYAKSLYLKKVGGPIVHTFGSF